MTMLDRLVGALVNLLPAHSHFVALGIRSWYVSIWKSYVNLNQYYLLSNYGIYYMSLHSMDRKLEPPTPYLRNSHATLTTTAGDYISLRN